jgi:hypothetical protein
VYYLGAALLPRLLLTAAGIDPKAVTGLLRRRPPLVSLFVKSAAKGCARPFFVSITITTASTEAGTLVRRGRKNAGLAGLAVSNDRQRVPCAASDETGFPKE